MTSFRCKFSKRAFRYNHPENVGYWYAGVNLEIVVKVWELEEAISNGKKVIKDLGIPADLLTLVEVEEIK
jgi:hypothetical protein